MPPIPPFRTPRHSDFSYLRKNIASAPGTSASRIERCNCWYATHSSRRVASTLSTSPTPPRDSSSSQMRARWGHISQNVVGKGFIRYMGLHTSTLGTPEGQRSATPRTTPESNFAPLARASHHFRSTAVGRSKKTGGQSPPGKTGDGAVARIIFRAPCRRDCPLLFCSDPKISGRSLS